MGKGIRAMLATAVLASTVVASTSNPAAAVIDGVPIGSKSLQIGGDYEWLVRLEATGESCTGSLIAADWVLTARHCLTMTTAYVGDDAFGVPIDEEVSHPVLDAALVHLAVPSTRTPVRLGGDKVNVGDTAVFAGWGVTSNSGIMPSSPTWGMAPVSFVSSEEIFMNAPMSTCYGDSGGPILIGGLLAAITYAGDPDCNLFSLGVRVSAIQSWISSYVTLGGASPVALGGETTIPVDGIATVTIDFSDPDTPFADLSVTNVDFGSLDFIGCDGDGSTVPITCDLKPPRGQDGDFRFTYTVSDGVHDTTAVWVIHVVDVPQPPVAQDSLVYVLLDTVRSIELVAQDPNNDGLQYTVVSGPSHGTLSDCAYGRCDYTPATGYLGSDSFTFTAFDGTFTSNTATVSVEVRGNIPPVAYDVSFVTKGSIQIVFEAADEDQGEFPMEYLVVDGPTHGVLTDCLGAGCIYTPDPGFGGLDTITYKTFDGSDYSNLATATINVPTPNWTVTPLSVEGSAAQLARYIAGGERVSNVVFTGDERAIGTYTGAPSDYMHTYSGVVLGTGKVTDIVGPNLSEWTSTEFGLPGDDDVTSQAGVETTDAAVLEFDFVATRSSLYLSALFGSEEYPNVDPNFNDAAFIEVDGRRCLIGDADPISVMNVNDIPGPDGVIRNDRFFIDNYNDKTGDFELDGFTSGALGCMFQLTPGRTIHVKVAIADGGAGYVDSALMISARIGNLPPIIEPTPGFAGVEGETIALGVTVTDDDGDQLRYQWDLAASGNDMGNACTFGDFESKDTTISCNDDGTYMLRITAYDGVNPEVQADVLLTISNAAPTLTVTNPLPISDTEISTIARSTIIVRGKVTDAGANDQLMCRFEWGDGSTTELAATEGECASPHQFSPGVFQVVVTAFDDDGGASASSVFKVTATERDTQVAGAGSIGEGSQRTAVEISVTIRGGWLVVRAPSGTFVMQTLTSLSKRNPTATINAKGTWNGITGYTVQVTVVDGMQGVYKQPDTVTVIVKSRTGATVLAVRGAAPTEAFTVR